MDDAKEPRRRAGEGIGRVACDAGLVAGLVISVAGIASLNLAWGIITAGLAVAALAIVAGLAMRKGRP